MMQLQRNMISKLGSQDIKLTESLFHAQIALTSNQEISALDVDQKRKM
jgi:hypothetical protein